MFYLKLASTNLKKNHRGYLPFLISMLFLVAINTMTQVIVNNEGMRALPGGDSASSMFGLGHIVIMIFTVIFSFYTNSFLLKQRKKELGLYNILGLGKRELYQLMIWESFLSFFIVLITGLITGVVLSKLAFLVLRRLISVGNEFVFQLLPESLGFVFLLFLNQLLANQKDQPYFASAWKQKGRTGTKSTLDHRYFGLGLFRKRLWDRGYN